MNRKNKLPWIILNLFVAIIFYFILYGRIGFYRMLTLFFIFLYTSYFYFISKSLAFYLLNFLPIVFISLIFPLISYVYSIMLLISWIFNVLEKNNFNGIWRYTGEITSEKFVFNSKNHLIIDKKIIEDRLKLVSENLYNKYTYKKRNKNKSNLIIEVYKKQHIYIKNNLLFFPINMEMTENYISDYIFLLIFDLKKEKVFKFYPLIPDSLSFFFLSLLSGFFLFFAMVQKLSTNQTILAFMGFILLLYSIYFIFIFLVKDKEDYSVFLDIIQDAIKEGNYNEEELESICFPQFFKIIKLKDN